MFLTDLKMPISDGFVAIKEIRKLKPNLPIIVQTAYSDKLNTKKAYNAGCDNFITKPIVINDFIKIINTYLHLEISDLTN